MKRSTISLIIGITGLITMLFSFYLLFVVRNSEEILITIFGFIMSGLVGLLGLSDYEYAKTFNR